MHETFTSFLLPDGKWAVQSFVTGYVLDRRWQSKDDADAWINSRLPASLRSHSERTGV